MYIFLDAISSQGFRFHGSLSPPLVGSRPCEAIAKIRNLSAFNGADYRLLFDVADRTKVKQLHSSPSEPSFGEGAEAEFTVARLLATYSFPAGDLQHLRKLGSKLIVGAPLLSHNIIRFLSYATDNVTARNRGPPPKTNIGKSGKKWSTKRSAPVLFLAHMFTWLGVSRRDGGGLPNHGSIPRPFVEIN